MSDYTGHTPTKSPSTEFGDVLEHDKKNSRRFERAGRQTSAKTGGGKLRFWLAYPQRS